MTANPALQLQELCDHITGFLHDSMDLKSCALVSPTFTSSAQRHLFHDIILNPNCLDIDYSARLEPYDESGSCKRLCAVLADSQHLRPLIRRLRVGLEYDLLDLLCRVGNGRSTDQGIPNLRDLVFHRQSAGYPSGDVVDLASKLISAPSIVQVRLLSVPFRSTRDLQNLFQSCTPTLDSVVFNNIYIGEQYTPSIRDIATVSRRTKIKTLRWATRNVFDASIQWLLDPLSPLDLSEVEDANYAPPMTPGILTLLENACFSIRRLTLDAQYAVNPDFARHLLLPPLARFPGLTHLTIESAASRLRDVQTLLASLAPGNQMVSIRLEITKVGELQADAIQGIAGECTLASMPALRTVAVHVRRFPFRRFAADTGDILSMIRGGFAELDARGRLEVVVQ